MRKRAVLESQSQAQMSAMCDSCKSLFSSTSCCISRLLNSWHRELSSRHQGIDGLPAAANRQSSLASWSICLCSTHSLAARSCRNGAHAVTSLKKPSSSSFEKWTTNVVKTRAVMLRSHLAPEVPPTPRGCASICHEGRRAHARSAQRFLFLNSCCSWLCSETCGWCR